MTNYPFLRHPDWVPGFMNEQEWEDTKVLMNLTRIWLVKFYGERCEEVSESCLNCRLWKAYDEIYGDFEL